MITLHVGRKALGVGMAVVLLAGCAGAQTVTNTVPAAASLARAASSPPACKGQHTTKKYGDISATLKAKGGAFCVPAFGGFGGSISYPGVEPSVKLTVRTSAQNIYDEPQLGTTGTSMVYLNLHFHEGTHFGTKLESKGGLTSQSIDPGDAYTAYGIVAVGNLYLRFPPCYTIATSGPYGGVLPNLGNLFSDTTITGPGYGVIEIYPGAQVSEEC
jgi:hypothetical protein